MSATRVLGQGLGLGPFVDLDVKKIYTEDQLKNAGVARPSEPPAVRVHGKCLDLKAEKS